MYQASPRPYAAQDDVNIIAAFRCRCADTGPVGADDIDKSCARVRLPSHFFSYHHASCARHCIYRWATPHQHARSLAASLLSGRRVKTGPPGTQVFRHAHAECALWALILWACLAGFSVHAAPAELLTTFSCRLEMKVLIFSLRVAKARIMRLILSQGQSSSIVARIDFFAPLATACKEF